MLKPFLAIFAGVFASFVAVMLGDGLGHALYPPPAGFDFNNPELRADFISKSPLSAQMALLFGQFLAGFVCAWVCNRVARGSKYQPAPIAIVGLSIAALLNLKMVGGNPVWFWVANMAVILVGGWFGIRQSKRADPTA